MVITKFRVDACDAPDLKGQISLNEIWHAKHCIIHTIKVITIHSFSPVIKVCSVKNYQILEYSVELNRVYDSICEILRMLMNPITILAAT